MFSPVLRYKLHTVGQCSAVRCPIEDYRSPQEVPSVPQTRETPTCLGTWTYTACAMCTAYAHQRQVTSGRVDEWKT